MILAIRKGRHYNNCMKTTYLTEEIKKYDNPDHALHGSKILTVTLWAGSERIQNFGGVVGDDPSEIREKAQKAANDWDGLTEGDIRAYDDFIREMDKNNWSV